MVSFYMLLFEMIVYVYVYVYVHNDDEGELVCAVEEDDDTEDGSKRFERSKNED